MNGGGSGTVGGGGGLMGSPPPVGGAGGGVGVGHGGVDSPDEASATGFASFMRRVWKERFQLTLGEPNLPDKLIEGKGTVSHAV